MVGVGEVVGVGVGMGTVGRVGVVGMGTVGVGRGAAW